MLQDHLVAPVQTVGIEPDPERRIRQRWGQNLAQTLEMRGESRKWLVNELAKIGVPISLQAVGYWINGDTAPTPAKQAALANVLQVPVHALFPITVEDAA